MSNASEAAPASTSAGSPVTGIGEGDHLVLVDGSAFIFRAFHALPPLTRKSDGLPVGAVAGFCNMIWKLLQEGPTGQHDEPTHFAVIFDFSSKTFRNELYSDYKAHRPSPPDDLIPQFGLIRQATRAFNLACVEQKGWEADDLIATYARQACQAGARTTIVSSDKDLMQLLGPTVIMVDTMKNVVIGEDYVRAKFGVGPEKMIDLQALCGDSVDNVPGVPGIGAKTAAQLLDEYGDLDTLLARAPEIKQPKRRENLVQFAEQARISRKLVTLCPDVPLDVAIGDLAVEAVDGPRAVAFSKAMEFAALTRRIAEKTGAVPDAVEPADLVIEGWSGKEGTTRPHGPDLPEASDIPPAGESGAAKAPGRSASARPLQALATGPVLGSPAMLAERRKAEAPEPKVDVEGYHCVRTLEDLDDWILAAREHGVVAVDTESTSLDPMSAELCGVSLAIQPNHACYIPLGHKSGEDDMFAHADGNGGLHKEQIPIAEALARLKPLLEEPSVLKIGQNIKYDWLLLSRHGIRIAPHDDTMLMSYALDAGRRMGHGMDGLSDSVLGHKPIAFKQVTAAGKAKTFDRVGIKDATCYAAEDADVTLRLWRVLKPRLAAEKLTRVYERLERPLVPVLARMEGRGIKVDRQMLSRLSGTFAQKAAGVEAEIFQMAGRSFNIGSPKQLGDILFGELGLPGGKKTKTGAWSTDVKVLDDLAAEGHALPRKIVEWRQLTKLKSTYTDALPTYINRETGRVHSSFSLASTTTGRLSSSEPNVQNIPVRTEEGREIRKAFIAEPGNKLVSADYSQIELRVLAHMAEIPQLRRAFEDGLDIHAMTASEMFGVPVEGMDPSVRRRAKAINFGIIYGISAFGLANQLAIGRGEAGDYIKRYFERFPGIRDYMEDTKRFARDNGYVETLFGRRAHYPDIRSSQPNVRAFNERAAINAPIQGTAADIIRRAMIRMEDALEEAKLSAKMLLQVHDELIFEVPEAEVDTTLPVVRRIMEKAAEPAVVLRVPLQVDARAASNWDEAH
ncbi:DNA polymerase I [Faunimonas pinastri]|uniref:DNA polymerase I n=1 Tax=Faunimonas pinastri TaxID=1855383 RepID=A0A1H9PTF8_9HYPH|nr:DNA polymerase I [Faunimonas pinastri]SER51418.1 DNA polymerase I [Faunimonas pinastri]